MAPVHRELDDDEVALSDDAMDRRGPAAQVVLERREGLSQSIAALRAGRVLDEVLGDVIEGRLVAPLHRVLEGHDRLCGRHPGITQLSAGRVSSVRRYDSTAP